MKPLAFRAVPYFITGALLSGVATAQTAATPPTTTSTAPVTNALNRMVAPPTAASPTENLLALAKAAGINVLADVDDASALAPEPAEQAKQRTLFKALKEMTDAQSWTWRRIGNETILRWKQPDFVALAQEIRNAESAPTAPNFAADAPKVALNLPAEPPNLEPLNVALTRYFATPAARSDAGKPASWREVSLLELPPEPRERILENVRGAQRSDLQFAASSAVLSDEWWQTAVLKIRELNAPAPRSPQTPGKRTPEEMLADIKASTNLQKYLFVAGTFASNGGSANTMLSLGRWIPEKVAP